MNRLTLALSLLVAACGGSGNGGNGNGDGGVGDGGFGDGDFYDACVGLCADAPPFSGDCDPQGAQCADCVDNDGDGATDGFDIHCSGPLDDDESSFATGIPGDNIDPVQQDCFFDGNSGAGNDRCNIHVCCILGAETKAECPIGANTYKPEDCPPPLGNDPLPQQCIDVCGPLTPPGCDCFGCCTVCDASNNCYDIAASASPTCNETNLADPAACLRCEKTESCGNTECGGDTCILCPGQTEADLPAGCNGNNTCPTGLTACDAENACAGGTFCSNGCCINVIQ